MHRFEHSGHVPHATGREELVLVTRRTFQEVMGPDLIAGIEQVMQRKVLAFLSANHVNPDVAVETFLLAPSTEHTPAQQLASPPTG